MSVSLSFCCSKRVIFSAPSGACMCILCVVVSSCCFSPAQVLLYFLRGFFSCDLICLGVISFPVFGIRRMVFLVGNRDIRFVAL